MSRFRRGRLGVVAAIAIVVALSLTGCSQSEPTSAKATSDTRPTTGNEAAETSSELTPVTVLRKAAEATAAHDTYRLHMVMSADGASITDMTMVTSADGSVQKSTINMEPLGQITMLTIDGVMYYQFPDLPAGKEWVRMDSDEMMGTTGIDPNALSDQNSNVLAMLENLSSDIEVVGEEKIEGMTSTHYRYKFDVRSMVDKALTSGGLTGEAAASADMFADSSEMNVWVGEDGLIRRMAYELDLSGAGAKIPSANMPGTFGYEMTFSDYGAALEVTAPDPGTTISMSEYIAASMGQGS